MQPPTLYVHNLHEGVKVSEMKRRLTLLFTRYRPIKMVYCSKTKKMKGQAFIELETLEDARYCLNKLNNLLLFDKKIFIEFAKKKKVDEGVNNQIKRIKLVKSKSLLISNLPFNIKVDELESIFKIYDGFESIRYVKPKNICIVDFSCVQKCSNCLDALDDFKINQHSVDIKYL